MSEAMLQSARRIADRFTKVAIVFAMLSLAVAVGAGILPVGPDVEVRDTAKRVVFTRANTSQQDVNGLLMRMAGRPLIRPSQVQAAVKDTGAAQRLLKKLKLHGVVQVGSDLVAYVQVDTREVKTVRKGEKLLGFVVKVIEPGRITLSLDGVEVVLSL